MFAYILYVHFHVLSDMFHRNTLLLYSFMSEEFLEAVHADSLGCLGWVQQVRGMARGAARRAVLAVGVTPSLPSAAPGARAGGPPGAVSFYMFTEVVAAHESLVAHRAGEPFLSGVGA